MFVRFWITMSCVSLGSMLADSRSSLAQDYREDVSGRYVVNYWCEEWKYSKDLFPAEAEIRAAALRLEGAEVQIVDVGVYPPPGTRFPDVNKISKIQQVQYRVRGLKYKVFETSRAANAAQVWFQALGLNAKITLDYPMRDIPRTAEGYLAEKLAKRTEWSGIIAQQGRTLPAKLTLFRDGKVLSGQLSFTFQKMDYLGRPGEIRPHLANLRGELSGDTIRITLYQAVLGKVYVPTQYVGRLSTTGRYSGEWTHEPARLAGTFDFALVK